MHSLADSANAPEETTTQRELREIMDNAVLELADNFREVILCRFYLSMPAVEVAERMGYSNPQDIHSLYDRAKDAWRIILEPRIRAWLREG
jgi:DNA-directed RNA polymerase specialized sigma24 family protein